MEINGDACQVFNNTFIGGLTNLSSIQTACLPSGLVSTPQGFAIDVNALGARNPVLTNNLFVNLGIPVGQWSGKLDSNLLSCDFNGYIPVYPCDPGSG